MKKAVLLLTVVLLMLSLFGCQAKTFYRELLHPVDEVKEIKIIELLGDHVYSDDDYTLLKVVDVTDFAAVFEDIQTIEYELPAFPSGPATPYGTSILIVYENGEYEVISCTGPQQYKYSEEYEKLLNHHSYYYCKNEEQYNQMIDKWLEAAETAAE